jgi:hypothetical protein
MKIVEDDRILPTHGEIIAIVAFSLQLFTNLSESHPEKCNDYIEKVLKKIVSLILGLAVIPTFGKKVKKEGYGERMMSNEARWKI